MAPSATTGPNQYHLQGGTHEVRAVDGGDLGLLVSVTIVPTIDVGSTTFTVLIPVVVLPADARASVRVDTVGITTVHRVLFGSIGHPQREAYSTIDLSGTASDWPLPL